MTPADHGPRADGAPDRGLVPLGPPGSGSAWVELGAPPRGLRPRRRGRGRDARGRSHREARLALTGVGDRPVRAREAEARLAREALTPACSPTPPRRSGARSTPAATSTRPPRTVATSRACSPGARSGSRRRARRGPSVPDPAPIEVRLPVNGREHAESVAPRLLLSDFLRHAPGPDRHPRRLRARRLRRLHRAPRRRGGAVVPAPRRPGRRRRGDDRRGARGDGRPAPPGPAGLPRDARASSAGSARRASCCRSSPFLRDVPAPSDDEIRLGLAGNLCRCTGYQNIVRAVRRASELLSDRPPPVWLTTRARGLLCMHYMRYSVGMKQSARGSTGSRREGRDRAGARRRPRRSSTR